MLRILLITGAARSGTSLISGIFDSLGAYGGYLVGASRENPHGFFENCRIREEVEKPALRACGADALCQSSFPPIGLEIPELRETVLQIFRRQGWDGDRPLYYKSAKICHYWPTWTHAFPEAVWVVVRRRKEEVTDSCRRAGFMRFAPDDDWGAWFDEHLPRFDELRKLGAIEINVDDLRRCDFSRVRQAAEAVGLPWYEWQARRYFNAEILHEINQVRT